MSRTKPKSDLHSLFRSRPSPSLEDEFRAHVRATFRPETFPGLHPGPIPKNTLFFKLTPVDIDRNRRAPDDKIPCPMCQPNKFLSGFLVWIPSFEAIAVIGHCCAEKEILAAADKEYKERVARRQQEEFLLEQLPLVPACIATILQAGTGAEHALHVHRTLKKDGAPFFRMLQEVNRSGGNLRLAYEAEVRTAGIGPSGYRGSDNPTVAFREFGRLEGSTALLSTYNPVQELDRIYRLLAPHTDKITEDEIIDYIVSLSPQRRQIAATEIASAKAAFEKYQSRIVDFANFFSPSNLGRISAWASAPEQRDQFHVEFKYSTDKLNLTMRSGSAYVRVVALSESWRALKWPLLGSR